MTPSNMPDAFMLEWLRIGASVAFEYDRVRVTLCGTDAFFSRDLLREMEGREASADVGAMAVAWRILAEEQGCRPADEGAVWSPMHGVVSFTAHRRDGSDDVTFTAALLPFAGVGAPAVNIPVRPPKPTPPAGRELREGELPKVPA